MAQHYSIKDVCHVLRVPRSAYYAWLNRRPSQRAADNQQLREKLATLFVANRSVYGSPRLRVCLQKEGIPCSRNRVARHMRAMHLKARQKRAFKPKTTDANPPHPIAPNRLREVGRPKGPTGSGSATSPISPPPKAGSTWQPSWTFTAGRSSYGPPATHWKHPW